MGGAKNTGGKTGSQDNIQQHFRCQKTAKRNPRYLREKETSTAKEQAVIQALQRDVTHPTKNKQVKTIL